MSNYHLAEVNIGTLRDAIDSPMIADFAANLDRINALAEGQPGFVWRLTGDGNNATDIQPDPTNPLLAINLSVWTDPDALAAFVYRTAHRDIMRRRAEWFEKMELFMCLWWVPVGHQPTPREAIERLEILRQRGPSAEAFTFRQPFPAPDAAEPPDPILEECA
jgi:hypothetical protein